MLVTHTSSNTIGERGCAKINPIPVGLIFIPEIALLLLLLTVPPELDTVLFANWLVDSIFLYASTRFLSFMLIYRKIDLFSPLVFFSAIFILLFYITPLYDIYTGSVACFGVTDLFEYGIDATLIASLGYFVLLLSFMLVSKHRPRNTSSHHFEKPEPTLARSALIIWFALFIIGVSTSVAANGFSISYILSFGLLGNSNSFETTTTPLGFISQLSRGVVTAYIAYFAVGNNKAAKVILFVLTLSLQIINGFRYMMVILVIGMIYFSCVSSNRRISIPKLLAVALFLLVMIGIVGYTRDSVRAGAGFNISGFVFMDSVDAFFNNLRIYKAYYAVIKSVPDITPFIGLKQIVGYTAILIIPRAIWPSKPLPTDGSLPLLYGINQSAVDSGYAYPCVGEYYHAFGFIGVLVFMGIIGICLATLENKFRNCNSDLLDCVVYSTLVATMFQLIIRGYTPTNFFLVVAISLPYFILRKISPRELKHHDRNHRR